MNRYNNTKFIIHLILSSVTICFCIAITVMLGIFGAKVSDTKEFVMSHECDTAAPTTAPPAVTEETATTPERMYVLGVKDGKLTIYASDGYTVIDTLDTYVYSLPLADREAVAQGISVYSVNELISLIEDYTS